MLFIESHWFAADIQELLSDEAYSELQQHLAAHPDAGDVIKDTGGLRKIRWAVKGRGKSGGVRVIYFHLVARQQIRLLLIYRKGIKDDLSPAEKKTLRALNEGW